MPQLLVELFSEEIPARMQPGAARDLERMAGERLTAAGLEYGSLTTFSGPRRLTLVVEGLAASTPDREEEVKGPKTSAPAAALEGFLRKTGLSREELVERDGVLFAVLRSRGQKTADLIPGMIDQIVRTFPWPKSMRWGDGSLRWVRPLKRILAIFDGEVVPFEIDGVTSGDVTEGHRFMGSGQPFPVRSFEDYRRRLEAEYVLLDAADRRLRILEGARRSCAERGLVLVDDDGLLAEVAGLAEWPTPILGEMDPQFLDLPPEVVQLSMKVHQKYFAVRDPSNQRLAPNFVIVANVEAIDGGEALATGNSRVLSARLNDARFFWDEDRKSGNFATWASKLEGVTFHARLGTVAERVERIADLAGRLAPLVGAEPAEAESAARLSKADLASGMVGEFPELQGVMGGYYVREAGLPDSVAEAVRDHYRPQGPADRTPTAPLAVAVALADKLDTLAGFFSIDEKPTGSKDPFALRRSALGVIRLVLENQVRAPLRDLLTGLGMPASARDDLLAFFADRLKVLLRDQGQRHDLVDAVFALGDDDLVRIVARVAALAGFLASDDGSNLLAGHRRASNILKAEAKKGALPQGMVETGRSGQPAAETELAFAVAAAGMAVDQALAREDFASAMSALAGLRVPVDAFFDQVLVNSDDPAERDNRLKLLGQVRDVMDRVADFGRITV